MKIIGVTGKSGSGKTTFSEILNANLSNAEIIHIDDIGIELKQKFLPFLFKSIPTNNTTSSPCMGVSQNANTILAPKKIVLKLFFLFPFLNKIQLKFVQIFGKKILREKINSVKKNKKDFVIIEGLILNELFNNFDIIYRLERSGPLRENGLFARDGSKFIREFKKRDTLYKFTKKNKNERIITNNSKNFQDFQAEILPLIDELQQTRATTFAKKYRVIPPQKLTESCKIPLSSHSTDTIEPQK